MASLSIGKYTFVAYSNDHNPRHVHGFEGNEIEVIIDLREDRTAAIADRNNAFWPENLRIAKARKMLDVAAKNFDALVALWEKDVPNKRAKVSSNADMIAAFAEGLAEVGDTSAAESVKYVPAHDIFIIIRDSTLIHTCAVWIC